MLCINLCLELGLLASTHSLVQVGHHLILLGREQIRATVGIDVAVAFLMRITVKNAYVFNKRRSSVALRPQAAVASP